MNGLAKRALFPRPLLHKHDLPVVVSQTRQLLVVVDVEKRFPRALRSLPGQVGHEIVAVEMNLVGHVADLVAVEQFVLDLRVTGDCQEVGSMSRWATISSDT